MHLACASGYDSTRSFHQRDSEKRKQLEALKRRGRTDWDVLKDAHRFLQDKAAGSEASSSALTYEEQVALKYYNQLYKEVRM